MTSRYDQPDVRRFERPHKWAPLDELPAVPLCLWCDRPCVSPDHDPYCSPLCAVQAAVDSEDN